VFLLGPARIGAGSPGRSLLRSYLPDRGHGGRRAVTPGEPRGLGAARLPAGGPPSASLALRGGPHAGAPRGDENAPEPDQTREIASVSNERKHKAMSYERIRADTKEVVVTVNID